MTLLDPSGPLARLCDMPELRPHARVLNLTGSEQGTLAPYSLIPTPIRGEFTTGATGDREFEIAVSNARAERRMLVQDICMMLVPPQVAREASTATLLRHAVRQVPAEEMIIANLTQNAKTAQQAIARAISQLPEARTCGCKDALATAIITRPDAVPAQTKKDLEPIIGKYMK